MPLLLLLLLLPIATVAEEEQIPEIEMEIFAQVGVRAAPVDDDGIFQINNIPLDLDGNGRLIGQQHRRVRFYARIGDALVKGNSQLFKLQGRDENGDFAPNVITSIDYSQFQDLPSQLTMSLNKPVLYTDDSVLLNVVAHYVDGSTKNLWTENSGLSIDLSDPSLLNIATDGTVTVGPNATKTTTVAVMAYFDGLVASQNIKIVPSVDLDGDGMSDSWERLYRLNYNDAGDRDLDADADGLTNFQEFQIGSNPLLPDTDNDGLLDGVDPEPLVPESVKPNISMSAPLEGADLIRGEYVHISGTASDNAGIKSVRIVLGGVGLGLASFDSNSGTYSLTALVTSPEGSEVPLTAIASDIAGNTKAISISVDISDASQNKPPIVDAGEDAVIPRTEYEVPYVLMATVQDEALVASGEGMPEAFQDIMFGLPTPNLEDGFITQWTSIGENGAFFDSPNSVSAIAYLDRLGEFELQLTANDGEYIGSDTVKITVVSGAALDVERVSLNDGQQLSRGVMQVSVLFQWGNFCIRIPRNHYSCAGTEWIKGSIRHRCICL